MRGMRSESQACDERRVRIHGATGLPTTDHGSVTPSSVTERKSRGNTTFWTNFHRSAAPGEGSSARARTHARERQHWAGATTRTQASTANAVQNCTMSCPAGHASRIHPPYLQADRDVAGRAVRAKKHVAAPHPRRFEAGSRDRGSTPQPPSAAAAPPHPLAPHLSSPPHVPLTGAPRATSRGAPVAASLI